MNYSVQACTVCNLWNMESSMASFLMGMFIMTWWHVHVSWHPSRTLASLIAVCDDSGRTFMPMVVSRHAHSPLFDTCAGIQLQVGFRQGSPGLLPTKHSFHDTRYIQHYTDSFSRWFDLYPLTVAKMQDRVSSVWELHSVLIITQALHLVLQFVVLILILPLHCPAVNERESSIVTIITRSLTKFTHRFCQISSEMRSLLCMGEG